MTRTKTDAGLARILSELNSGEISLEQAIGWFQTFPYEQIEDASPDTHREARQGFAETIYADGKTADQLVAIAGSLLKHSELVIATRASRQQAEAASRAFPDRVTFLEKERMILLGDPTAGIDRFSAYRAAVITAGTSDTQVAGEASEILRLYGVEVGRIDDVGVAGLHRLLARKADFVEADAIIVVAGMDGALPSVVGGLVACPVVAVPTSVGYGTSFGGIAAFLTMLNSCASGVTVVNIDNGFGAAMAVLRIFQTMRPIR